MPAALVDDVHFAARLPGHLLMGALLNVMNRHRDEVEAEGRRSTHVITLINSRARNLI